MALADDEISRLFLMAGLGMLGAPSVPQGISRGGMFALQDLDQQRELKAKRQLADAKLAEEALQAEKLKLAIERQQKLNSIYGGQAQMQPAGSMRSVVDAPGWTPQVPQARPKDIGQMLLEAGYIEEAKKFAEARGALHGEAYGDLKVTKEGKPYYMTKQGPRYAEDGSIVPREKLHFAETGDRAGVGLDPFTGAVVSQGLQRNMSPAEQDAAARGWASFNRGVYDQDRGGFATPRGFAGVPNLPASPTKAREDIDNLRKEFNALPEVKAFKDVAAVYNNAAKAPDTPAGDFALIYGVGKVLDPGSVVREGEMNMVIASGSPAQRVSGYLSFLQGNGRLTPAQRSELQTMLMNAADERQTLYSQARSTYEGIASKRGYSPEEVFTGAPELLRTFNDGKSVRGSIGRGKSGAQIEAEIMAELERRKKRGG